MGPNTPIQETMVWVRYFRKNGCSWGGRECISGTRSIAQVSSGPRERGCVRWGQFSRDALEGGGEGRSQSWGLGISSGGGGASDPRVPNSTTKRAALLRKRDVGSPVLAKSTLNAQTLLSASKAPPNPIGRSSRQSARTPPPARL